jgi:hypothetical protein
MSHTHLLEEGVRLAASGTISTEARKTVFKLWKREPEALQVRIKEILTPFGFFDRAPTGKKAELMAVAFNPTHPSRQAAHDRLYDHMGKQAFARAVGRLTK